VAYPNKSAAQVVSISETDTNHIAYELARLAICTRRGPICKVTSSSSDNCHYRKSEKPPPPQIFQDEFVSQYSAKKKRGPRGQPSAPWHRAEKSQLRFRRPVGSAGRGRAANVAMKLPDARQAPKGKLLAACNNMAMRHDYN
jgi:hypothetical protein